MTRLEIIKPDGDLKREKWVFEIRLSIGRDGYISFDYFGFETRPTRRHRKWTVQNQWSRFSLRDSTMPEPVIPPDIEVRIRELYKAMIRRLPIVGGKK